MGNPELFGQCTLVRSIRHSLQHDKALIVLSPYRPVCRQLGRYASLLLEMYEGVYRIGQFLIVCSFCIL